MTENADLAHKSRALLIEVMASLTLRKGGVGNGGGKHGAFLRSAQQMIGGEVDVARRELEGDLASSCSAMCCPISIRIPMRER